MFTANQAWKLSWWLKQQLQINTVNHFWVHRGVFNCRSSCHFSLWLSVPPPIILSSGAVLTHVANTNERSELVEPVMWFMVTLMFGNASVFQDMTATPDPDEEQCLPLESETCWTVCGLALQTRLHIFIFILSEEGQAWSHYHSCMSGKEQPKASTRDSLLPVSWTKHLQRSLINLLFDRNHADPLDQFFWLPLYLYMSTGSCWQEFIHHMFSMTGPNGAC